MKNKFKWVILISILVALTIVERPMSILLNFIVGGVIPGLNISLGFLPFIGVVISIIWATFQLLKNTRRQMIKHATKLNRLELKTKEFKELNSGEGETISSSVIAAPTKLNKSA